MNKEKLKKLAYQIKTERNLNEAINIAEVLIEIISAIVEEIN